MLLMSEFSDGQRLRGVRAEARLQHVAGQTAADDSVRRQESDGQQHGDVHVHPVSACIRRLRRTLRLGQRLAPSSHYCYNAIQ